MPELTPIAANDVMEQDISLTAEWLNQATDQATDQATGSFGKNSLETDPELGLINKTLAGKFKWLTFEQPLEKKFVNEMLQSQASNAKKSDLSVNFFWMLLIVSDYVMLPDMFHVSLELRLGVLMPLGLAMIVSHSWLSMRHRELVVFAFDLLGTGIYLYLCVNSSSPLAQYYLMGITAIILFVTSHMRTRFWVSMLTCFSIVMMYFISVALMKDLIFAVAWFNGLMLITFTISTLYNLYGLEHEQRFNALMTWRHQWMQNALKKANQQLDRVAKVDPLTQVANRRHFDQFIHHVWERSKRDASPVTVLMIDVDHFKEYNDHFGHIKGDECLVQVAQAISNSIRKPGDLLARYGGEEFIAVLSKADDAQGKMAAERVRTAVFDLNLPHPHSVHDGRITVSVGIATTVAQADMSAEQQLIAQADKALYQAKNAGRNGMCAYGA